MVLGFTICCLGFRVQLRLKGFSEDWLDLGSLLVVGSFRIGIWIRGSQTTVKVSIFVGGDRACYCTDFQALRGTAILVSRA